jgi:cell division protease FtsH
MVVLLGGRVAEHVVFGAITTGASDDLKRVYELSRAMIAEYGMGTELMSRRLPADDYSVSDATRRLVDDEQQHLTDLAWRSALAIIVEHRALLDALAATLLEQEVLERTDIERIVDGERLGDSELDQEQRDPAHVPDPAPPSAPVAGAPVTAVSPAEPLPHAPPDAEPEPPDAA